MFAALKRLIAYSPKLEAWHRMSMEETQYTPDVSRLEISTHQPVFIYNDWMQRRRDHAKIEGSEYRGTAFTYMDNFTMFIHNLGPDHRYPIALMGNNLVLPPDGLTTSKSLTSLKKAHTISPRYGDKVPPRRIKGELFRVPSSHVVKLDNLLLNTVQFIRIKVPIVIYYRKSYWSKAAGTVVTNECEKHRDAWIYLGIRSYWDDIIDGGFSYQLATEFKPLNSRSNQDRLYYYYTQEDVESNTK